MKKRIFSLLIVLSLVLGSFTAYGTSEGSSITFNTNKVELVTETGFSLNVLVETDKMYSGMQFELLLPEGVEFVSYEVLEKNKDLNKIKIEKNGLIVITVFGDENIFTGENEWVKLNLTFEGTGSKNIELKTRKLAITLDGDQVDAEGVTLTTSEKVTVTRTGEDTDSDNDGSTGGNTNTGDDSSNDGNVPSTGGSTSGDADTESTGTEAGTEEDLGDEEIAQTLLPITFKDLNKASWAKDYITYIAARGIVNGLNSETFDPNGTVTREAYTKMLVEAYNLVDKEAVSTFTDLKDDAWYYTYIASAEKAGITDGMGDGTFGLGLTITREQMATMTYRAMKIAGVDEVKGEGQAFDDDDTISNYAKGSVYAMQEAGIINGVGDNKFAPKDTATRAQAAKIIYYLIFE